MKHATFLILIICAVFSARAQVAGNSPYTLEQTVIASGGGAGIDGSQFSVTGAFGQPAAGTTSTLSPYKIAGGFFTAAPLAPTVAGVSLSGRILTPAAKGLNNAVVVLTSSDGQTISTRSTAFGYYRFEDIPAGQTVILHVNSKRFQFAPRVITLQEDLVDFDIEALFQN